MQFLRKPWRALARFVASDSRMPRLRPYAQGARMESSLVDETPSKVSKFNPAYFVHFGNVVMLAGLAQTDMLNLRCMLVVASTCGISYNLLQPKPLIAPALWGFAFLGMHCYMILMLYRERQELTLDKEEEEVFNQAFMPYGFTKQQFLDILDAAKPHWRSWSVGQNIMLRGSDMAEMNYLVEGKVAVLSSTDDPLHHVRPGKGGWLGEFFDPNRTAEYWDKPHKWPVTFKCVSDQCRTMALPRRELDNALMENPRLKEAATRAAVSDVWGKLFDTIKEMRVSAYQAMLEVALIDGVLEDAERSMLVKFRERHKISEQFHSKLLKELQWSTEEFAAGRKKARR